MIKRPNVLLVEDDEALRQGWSDVFELLEFPLQVHERGLEAAADVAGLLRAEIIITDFYLPDINGVELVKKARKVRPDLKAIVLTGSREHSVVAAVKALEGCLLVHKPVNIDELELKISEALRLP